MQIFLPPYIGFVSLDRCGFINLCYHITKSHHGESIKYKLIFFLNSTRASGAFNGPTKPEACRSSKI